jgi:hypothetical protein
MGDRTHLKNSVRMIVFLLLLPIVPAFAGRIIYVDDDGPADFNKIQAAIDDANDGDTVIVADGVYKGPANRGIDFRGKAITVRSKNGADSCIIDCQQQAGGFYFTKGETSNSLLHGFTIMNGSAAHGGGIRCLFSSPTIANCVIKNNTAPLSPGFPGSFSNPGGGIGSEVSSPMIVNCIIVDNTATSDGGGIWCYTRGDPRYSPTIRNCIIARNTADGYGGGVYRCDGKIINCTICYNSSHGVHDCDGRISNCIIWGNSDDINKCSATYSCIGEDAAGEGNVHADPCFADPNKGDYHLKSQAGRWEPSENFKFQITDSKLANGMWVQDDVTSPCIDAGNPTTPIGLEPFPNGGIINMGAYGGMAEASKSYFGEPVCETIVAGDINGDCKVDFADFVLMALHWLQPRPTLNSNRIIQDKIEYYIETNKSAYHVGENVEVAFRVTNSN